jgi:hypothetical protein
MVVIPSFHMPPWIYMVGCTKLQKERVVELKRW